MQRFYDWYVPAAAAAHGDQLALLANAEAKAAIAPELLRAWKEDREAQARNRDEIVGLEFDPVTASQDPCDRYEAVRARQTGDTNWVDVRHTPGCGTDRDVDVTVQVTCTTPDTCAIFNFQYPGPPPFDLRSELQHLREERAGPTRRQRDPAAPSRKKR